jgi:hypothetical protein
MSGGIRDDAAPGAGGDGSGFRSVPDREQRGIRLVAASMRWKRKPSGSWDATSLGV